MSGAIQQRDPIREVGSPGDQARAADRERDSATTLAFEDFLWFLNEVRGTHYYCPYCGNDKFTAFTAAENPAAVKSRLAPGDCASHTVFHGVCCTKCGNTGFFADDVVRERLERHPHIDSSKS